MLEIGKRKNRENVSTERMDDGQGECHTMRGSSTSKRVI